MATIVMVRTVCCESFKCGQRCSICPDRPENRAALEQRQCQALAGRRVRAVATRPDLDQVPDAVAV